MQMLILRLVICIAAVYVSATFAQQQVHPCHGRNVGFARDIQSCAHFWRCGENPPSRGICPNQNTFDGELERCVLPRNSRCFQCGNRVPYELRSVPRICQQFTRCTSGTATLHACPNGLFFDGRNGIRNCNWRPAGGGCHRENENDGDNTGLCPSVVGHRVLYFRARGSCSRYFICPQANIPPIQGQCQSGLHFNIRNGICDRAENVDCDEEGTPERPPIQHGPAFRCPAGGGTFVPDRTSCSRFWACTADGRVHPQSCVNNAIFDHVSRQCVPNGRGRCWARENGLEQALLTNSNSTQPAFETDDFNNSRSL